MLSWFIILHVEEVVVRRTKENFSQREFIGIILVLPWPQPLSFLQIIHVLQKQLKNKNNHQQHHEATKTIFFWPTINLDIIKQTKLKSKKLLILKVVVFPFDSSNLYKITLFVFFLLIIIFARAFQNSFLKESDMVKGVYIFMKIDQYLTTCKLKQNNTMSRTYKMVWNGMASKTTLTFHIPF